MKSKNLKVIMPNAYKLKESEKIFTFKNLYIQYGRFHYD
jgi:hypothetical protein